MTRAVLRRRSKVALAVAALLLLPACLAEIGARIAGIGDYPLYQASERLGYVPAPNQSGAFLRTRRWVFNEISMGAGPFTPGPGCNLLLVGDSIVLGGNGFDQPQKLGPQLEQLIACRVWPISAGSWALLNELAYLDLHKADVLPRVERIVFVSNSGDFGEPSVWSSEATHPTHRPVLLVPYVLWRYFLASEPPPSPDRGGVDWEARWQAGLRDLVASFPGQVSIVLYPDRSEERDQALRDKRLLAKTDELKAAGAAEILDVAGDRRWNASLYGDDIHPSPAGTAVLAAIIAEGLHLPPRAGR